MKTNFPKPSRIAIYSIALSILLGSGVLLAQDQQPGPPPDSSQPDAQQPNAPANNGGWRRVDQPAPAATPAPPDMAAPAGPPPAGGAPQATMDPNYSQGPAPAPYPNQGPPPNQGGPYPGQGQPYPAQGGQYPYPGGPNQQYPPSGSYNPPPPPPPIPAKLTIQPGTYITVRLNQGLSSDRNQAGDAFAATLVKPVVVDGVVVADRGQTVGGHVVEAKKAGRVEGVSRLAVQLTDLTLLDGHPVPIQTKLFTKNGPTSQGRDAAAIAGTTATGAAVGAAVGWGTGAAIGAGAGALVGIVGVLVTRGHPTYLYPEQILTFRVEAPIAISTEAAPQAFRWVGPYDYDQPYNLQARMGPSNGAPYAPGYAAPGYGYPYPYAYAYPYYWGPGLGFYWGGRGYWGPRGYWGGRWGWRR
jgi:hypothetical protein